MSRILLSAYACEPGKGSEPGVGWMWATELAAGGHQVWVITRRANRHAIEDATWQQEGNAPHFVYYDLPLWVLRWKRGGRGIYWYYALWQWGAYRLTRQLTKEISFDCVHHVTFVGLRGPSFMGWLGLPFYLGPVSGGERVPAALRSGMSRTAKWREAIRDLANRAILADPVMRATFRRAQKILVTTAQSQQLIPRRYRDKCAVQLGVGLSREYLGWTGRKRTLPDTTLRLLYVGRLVEWKGVDLALYVVRGLRDRGHSVRFTIVGDGPARKALEQLTVELGVNVEVSWIGWIPQEQLHQHYNKHDALLFPSLRDSGGMVVLEALAHGLPVVCTDRGGPGVIVTERCGRRVRTEGRTKDEVIDLLTAAVSELAGDHVLLKKLSAGARSRAWEFDFRRVVASVYPASSRKAVATEESQLASQVSAQLGGANPGHPTGLARASTATTTLAAP
jgi:glycosyltransferase involved in cell wall biosynthesis